MIPVAVADNHARRHGEAAPFCAETGRVPPLHRRDEGVAFSPRVAAAHKPPGATPRKIGARGVLNRKGAIDLWICETICTKGWAATRFLRDDTRF